MKPLGARRRRHRPGRVLRGFAATTHADLTFPVHKLALLLRRQHAGAVPNTSTWGRPMPRLPYAVKLADRGWRGALAADAAPLGLTTHDGW